MLWKIWLTLEMEEIPDHNKTRLLWGPVKGRIIRGEWYKNNKLSRYPIWTKKEV